VDSGNHVPVSGWVGCAFVRDVNLWEDDGDLLGGGLYRSAG
jgi:hypothetical protein